MEITLNLVDTNGSIVSRKKALSLVNNTWLYRDEMKTAREYAATHNELECDVYLADLEQKCNERFRRWKFSL